MILYIFIFLLRKINTNYVKIEKIVSEGDLLQRNLNEYGEYSKRALITVTFELESKKYNINNIEKLLKLLFSFRKTRKIASISVIASIIIRKDINANSLNVNIEDIFDKIYSFGDHNMEYSNKNFNLTIFGHNIFRNTDEIDDDVIEKYRKNIFTYQAKNFEIQNVFHIFLFKDADSNYLIKKQLRKNFEDFCKEKHKVKNIPLSNKISFSQFFCMSHKELFNYLQKNINEKSDLFKYLINIDIFFFKFLEIKNVKYYQIIRLPLKESNITKKISLKHDYETESIFFQHYIETKFFLYRKYIYLVDYNFKHVTFKISGIQKDQYWYLLKNNFYKVFYDLWIHLILEQDIFLEYKLEINFFMKCKKNIKQIIIKTVNNNIELVNVNFENGNYFNFNFIPYDVEKEILYLNIKEKNDLSARKYLNFVNYLNNIINGRDYLYFYRFYMDKLNLDNEVNFYNREIFKISVNDKEICTVFYNAINHMDILKMNFKKKTQLEIVNFKVFTFKKSIFPNVNFNTATNKLKSLENHWFYEKELKYFSHIEELNDKEMPSDYQFHEFFLKIRLSNHVEHLVFFHPKINTDLCVDDYFDYNKCFNSLICLFDDVFLNSKMNLGNYNYDHYKAVVNFEEEHFKNIRNILFDNNLLQEYSENVINQGITKINTELCSNEIFIKEENKKLGEADYSSFFEMSKDKIPKYIMQKYISICRKSCKNKNYDASVLTSLSDYETYPENLLYMIMNISS